MSRSRLQALIPAALFLLAAAIAHPVLEMGMGDDFSYIRSAQLFAQTGHFLYVGWASAMIGWQLLLGALFIKLFGFSFTAVRASNLLVGVFTALLTHRILVRSGVSARNATYGTLTLILSPLVFASALSFMTDLGGLFVVALCLYACLRALQTSSSAAALGWLIFAALSDDVGGTVRQVAWLGALVLVPSTAWLLRRRFPRALAVAAVLWVVSIAFILGTIHWLNRQPYMLPESMHFGRVRPRVAAWLALGLVRSVLELALFLLPLLLFFLPSAPWRTRPRTALAAGGGILLTTLALGLIHAHRPGFPIAPFFGANVSPRGLIDATILHSERPVILPVVLQLALAALTFAGLAALVFYLAAPRQRQDSSKTPLSNSQFLTLAVPFTLAYFALISPRGAFFAIFDRYLLIPFLFALILTLRVYAQRIAPNLPRLALAPILLFAAFSATAAHDVFAQYRARAAAIAELRSSGIPAAGIDGGFEANGYTQFETTGFLNDEDIRVPARAYRPIPQDTDPCHPQMLALTPDIHARFGLSFTPSACAGPTAYAPDPVHNWLGRPQSIYIIRLPAY